LPGANGAEQGPIVPLIHAHAHNDYEHPHPLFDALANGFCSIEADVFLVDDQLQVGHTRRDLRPERTLESLYLNPLRERVRANGGRVYRDGPTIFLLVDVKTEAKPTCEAILKTLAGYTDMLSVSRDGQFEPGAVTVVVTGNCDRAVIAGPKVRYAAIDGRPRDLESRAPPELMPWISFSWSPMFHWKGDGPIPPAEKTKLRQFVAKAHAHGRLVRFWATPELVAVWEELRADGVDLLNTDKLEDLRKFLLHEGAAAQPTGEGGWTDLFAGKNLDAWNKSTGAWFVAGRVGLDPDNARRLKAEPGEGILVNGRSGRTNNLISRQEFADVDVHLEFLIPKRSNSGVKLMGLYEIQIFDSHGKKELTGADCGGIYPRAEQLPTYHHIDDGFAPRVNAARPAGEWQSLDIAFQAPRFDAAGKKTANARFVKVVLNGQVIHDNIEVPCPTGHAWRLKKEVPRGPLLLQADHGPVAFRNVRVRPLPGPEPGNAK
jgi:hypothetical protein